MKEPLDLQQYLSEGAEQIVKDALRATLKDPRQSAFFLRFAASAKRAEARRKKQESLGLHIPSYLIASITSSCNLHCAGCYSRHNHATEDVEPQKQLSSAEWNAIFSEAEELGVSFILLAGGEPLLRREVIEAAGSHPDMLFPIFTNGTYIDERYFALFDRCRNLLPVLSIEGPKEETDARRGEGVYDLLTANMRELKRRGLIFGASVTVTNENLREVLSDGFLNGLKELGCKAVLYIEYVPVDEDAAHLAPGDEEREYLNAGIDRLRRECPEMVFISFPGDEKSSGGCLAAGRGFFHINSHGGAEPCPFSPYSDINVRDTSLKEALQSKLFRALKDNGLLKEDHKGGCILFEKKEQVEALLRG